MTDVVQHGRCSALVAPPAAADVSVGCCCTWQLDGLTAAAAAAPPARVDFVQQHHPLKLLFLRAAVAVNNHHSSHFQIS